MIIKNDEAFTSIFKISLYHQNTKYIGLFDNIESLKQSKIIIGKNQYVFEEDYINSTLPQRIKDNRWELFYTGLLSKPKEFDVVEQFIEKVYLPHIRYSINILKNKLKDKKLLNCGDLKIANPQEIYYNKFLKNNKKC